MSDAELLDASRREHALYDQLLAVYRRLRAALAHAPEAVDPDWLAEQHARAEETAIALRGLAAALAPARMTGAVLPAGVREEWRASAAVAAEAATANREVTILARTRQAAIATRLAGTAGARRGLAAYRPAGAGRSRLADQRV